MIIGFSICSPIFYYISQLQDDGSQLNFTKKKKESLEKLKITKVTRSPYLC